MKKKQIKGKQGSSSTSENFQKTLYSGKNKEANTLKSRDYSVYLDGLHLYKTSLVLRSESKEYPSGLSKRLQNFYKVSAGIPLDYLWLLQIYRLIVEVG